MHPDGEPRPLIVGVLFIVIGWIYRAQGHLADHGAPGPAAARARAGRASFTVGMLASIGLPGLNGFVGEFLILIGTFLTHRWWAVVATAGVVLAAIYMLWAYQQTFHHEPDPAERQDPRTSAWREGAVVAPLVVLIIFSRRLPEAGARPDHALGEPAACQRRRDRPRRLSSPPWTASVRRRRPAGGPDRPSSSGRRVRPWTSRTCSRSFRTQADSR